MTQVLPDPVIPADNGAVQSVFLRYCRFGETALAETAVDLTSRNFVKLFKDCELMDKKITLTFLDLSFTKAARASVGSLDTSWGGKRINYQQFIVALEHCAEARGVAVDALMAKIVKGAAGGPTLNGTTAAGGGAAKFYDDKTQWTAVAKNGGPTKVDGGPNAHIASFNK
mmetsp:Transcript_2472/g.7047  ORF Transcript_2472/g.7047 Transcript_2472/m.7047 type:complete len:170 (+) Transcript_2472:1424-1933(+)